MLPSGDLLQAGWRQYEEGRHKDAEVSFREILRREPGNPAAIHGLGCIARDRGDLELALELLARASRLLPESAGIHSDVGRALALRRKFGLAIQRFELALRLEPRRQEDYVRLAGIYSEIGRSDKSLETCHRAIQNDCGGPALMERLTGAMLTQGRLSETLDEWQRVLRDKPNAALHSSLLFCSHYLPAHSAEEMFSAHCEFGHEWERPLEPRIFNSPSDNVGEKRLRIGYVSADFRRHSVAHLLRPVLSHHNVGRFEIFSYSCGTNADSVTRDFQQMAGERWRDISHLSDEDSAALIRRDAIDILVDLGGHTGGNRMLLFARKPAPLQVTWLGYPNTTGLRAMDYRITDAKADPPGLSDSYHTERLLRLPDSFLSYDPLCFLPPVAEPPVLRRKNITFGSFNNLMKFSPPVIGAWSNILDLLPDARLMLKHKDSTDVGAQRYLLAEYEKHGISRERIHFAAPVPSPQLHLESYQDIDIALDPFPYNGTTTTCEALLMGVPVLTLAGETHVSRVGVSLLTSVGLSNWIAESVEDYVRLAVHFATDRLGLKEVRNCLRAQFQASDLGDAARFTRHLEEAFETIWIEARRL